MHITRYTDYSLRVMMYVALRGDELCTIQEIADSYGISKNHLMKVVQNLNANGYLNAIRGKNGGLRLGKSPKAINIGSLVRSMEQDLCLVECMDNLDNCPIASACRLKTIMQKALTVFLKELDQYTLADLLQPRSKRPLIKLLDIA